MKCHRGTYQDEKHSLMMYECILVANCVLFQYKGPLFTYLSNKSDHAIVKTLTNASKKVLFVSSETDSSECSSEDDMMTKRFKNSEYDQEIPQLHSAVKPIAS